MRSRNQKLTLQEEAMCATLLGPTSSALTIEQKNLFLLMCDAANQITSYLIDREKLDKLDAKEVAKAVEDYASTIKACLEAKIELINNAGDEDIVQILESGVALLKKFPEVKNSDNENKYNHLIKELRIKIDLLRDQVVRQSTAQVLKTTNNTNADQQPSDTNAAQQADDLLNPDILNLVSFFAAEKEAAPVTKQTQKEQQSLDDVVKKNRLL